MTAGTVTAPSFLGTGWAFPVTFGPGGVEVAMVSDEEDIHQSLQILLATSRGERPMQELYGCDLGSVLFEEIGPALINRVTALVFDSIVEYEPRADLRGVEVSPGSEPGVLEIRIDYAIRGTNSRFNMVFPFYLNEATAPGR